MGTITALSTQKRSPDRVNVYIDGEFAFGLAYVAAARLHLGQILSAADIAALQELDAVEKAKENAMRFLSYRPRSQAEVQQHLQKKGYSETAIHDVIERLTAVDLLNDESFARYWVEQRETFKPRGQFALMQELQQKGIHPQLINRVLSELDETAAAQQAADKKARQLAGQPEAIFKQKLSQYLQRRGFPYDIIRATVDDLWGSLGDSSTTAQDFFD